MIEVSVMAKKFLIVICLAFVFTAHASMQTSKKSSFFCCFAQQSRQAKHVRYDQVRQQSQLTESGNQAQGMLKKFLEAFKKKDKRD